MEVHSTAQKILETIAELDQARKLLRERAEDKSMSIADYDRKIAQTIISLKNGKIYYIDGEEIQNPPATIMEKIARGICWQAKLNMELADSMYRNVIVTLNSIQAILNAYQSINRHQSEI